MQRETPIIEDGWLYQLATGADPIVVGTSAWYDWLERNTAFLFIDSSGEFIACKTATDAGDQQWQASCKRQGKLYQMNLGSSYALTLSRLQSAVQRIAGEHELTEPTDTPAAQLAVSLSPVCETGPSFGSTQPLLRTKLYPPPLSHDLILRDRLIKRLQIGLSSNLTLLCTPTGFGKSVLLAQWSETSNRPVIWLSLDKYDEDLTTFVHAFICALQTMFPDACPATAQLVAAQRFPPVEQVATLLLNELDDLPIEMSLVLDNYHLIRTSGVHALLALVIEHLPPSLHIVLSTRSEPPLPLARWRAKGLLYELRGTELRFTREETSAFLERIVGQPCVQAISELLQQLTEGWIALLRLAALSLRNATDPQTYLHRLANDADSTISGYLMEEVLLQQTPLVQDLLVQTSILCQFNAQLCVALLDRAVPGDHLQAILKWLEHVNLFLIPLDDRQGWYRYHPLFQQMLQQRLREECSPAAIARLHQRASSWYASQGLIEEAIEHALATGNVTEAVRVAESQFPYAFEQEQLAQMERWLFLLPESYIQESPSLLIARAWILQARGQLKHLPSLLQRAELLLESSSRREANDFQIRFLHALKAILWSLFQFFTGQPQASLESARAALEWISQNDELIAIKALRFLVWSSVATGQEDVALFELNKVLEEQLAHLNKALEEQSAHLNNVLNLLSTLALVYLTAGKLPQLELTAYHLLQLTSRDNFVLSQSCAHWLLGVLYYEWNQLDKAIYHFSLVITNQDQAHFWVTRDAMCGLALAYQAQGSHTQAQETAHALLELVQRQNDTYEIVVVYTFRAQLALLQGEVVAAEQWLELVGEHADRGPMLFYVDEHITRAHLLLVKGDEVSVSQAQALLADLLEHTEAIHNTRKTIKLLALQALAYHTQRHITRAIEVLERALALGRPSRFIRTFADLPQLARVVQELRKCCKGQRESDKSLESYLQHILTAMRPGLAQTVSAEALMQQEGLEPLTDREWQILHLLDKDLTNKEIAGKLVVTPGTVKVHTNSIYRKLNVNNRHAAVTLAKALGILDSDRASPRTFV